MIMELLTGLTLVAAMMTCVVLLTMWKTRPKITSAYTEHDCKEMMRGIILDWITDERKIIQPMADVTGSEINFIYNLNMINFKTVGLDDTTKSFLDEMILVDTNETRSYSRFLDLYRYLQLQIPIEYIDNYADNYFNGFKYLKGTMYEHTKQQLKDVRTAYPYLWLLEEISIVDRAISES